MSQIMRMPGFTADQFAVRSGSFLMTGAVPGLRGYQEMDFCVPAAAPEGSRPPLPGLGAMDLSILTPMGAGQAAGEAVTGALSDFGGQVRQAWDATAAGLGSNRNVLVLGAAGLAVLWLLTSGRGKLRKRARRRKALSRARSDYAASVARIRTQYA